MDALDLVLTNEDRTSDLLPVGVDLSFASEQWQRTILVRTAKGPRLARRHFEVCVFAAVAAALKAGDVAVEGSDADYREQLLPWDECEPQLAEYCQQVSLPTTASAFVEHLRVWLTAAAERVDAGFPSNGEVVITDKDEPVLKRGLRRQPSSSAQALEASLLERMPERSILDVLANVAHELSFTNRRHASVAQIEAAIKDLVNAYHRCDLPKVWGSGSSAAADGTKYELAENSLLAEYSIRYGGLWRNRLPPRG